MEDILIRPDQVFENYLTKAREGNHYCQDNLISLLAENEGFKRLLQPSDEQWMHQRMMEQEKEAEVRKANPDDLPFLIRKRVGKGVYLSSRLAQGDTLGSEATQTNKNGETCESLHLFLFPYF